MVRKDVICESRRNYHYSDDVAEFVAVTSLLGTDVPSVLAILVRASTVSTGLLCCLR